MDRLKVADWMRGAEEERKLEEVKNDWDGMGLISLCGYTSDLNVSMIPPKRTTKTNYLPPTDCAAKSNFQEQTTIIYIDEDTCDYP